MKFNNSSKEFYSNFKKSLVKSQKWPGIYMFKFILKSNKIKTDFFKKYFTKHRYSISIKESSKKNYRSVTIKSKMNSPDEVINIYKDLSMIDEIIVL
tara:strand:+ start:159 stop:449 length:291 start_codon:yes stop_codon:yes gene_type:complete